MKGVKNMLFQITNLDASSDELLKTIDYNCKKALIVRSQIDRLKVESKKVTEETLPEEDLSSYEIEKEEEKEEENDFEDEVNYYLEDLRTLEPDFTQREMLDILPSIENYNFKSIILRLQAECIKELKEIDEFCQDEDLTKLELEELKSLITVEKRKIKMLGEVLKEKEECIIPAKHHNKIILSPTLNGNIRVLDELEHISSEYYPAFKELINSIVDGTFKRVKRFTNNKALTGVCEVKGFKTRVIFSRINEDTYAIISVFVKKTNNDKGYQEYLKSRVAEYKNVADSIKNKVDDESFIDMNDQELDKLYTLLNQAEKRI
jgi:hypothetical protein